MGMKMKWLTWTIVAYMAFTASAFAYESLQGPTELLYWDKEKAYNGYTLFAAHGTTFLIDMEGSVINQWRMGTNPRFLKNGNILDATKDDPSSFKGFQELDWNGNVVWEFEERRADYSPHHDFVRIFNKKLRDYTTLYIANKNITREQAIAAGCDPSKAPSDGTDSGRHGGKGGGGRLARDGKTKVDAIVEVDMAGNVIWEWCFFDHLVQDFDASKSNYVSEGKTIADYPHRLNVNLPGKPLRGDWLHCNSMDYSPELDQVVVNSVQGEFYVIDHGNTFVPGDPEKSIELAAGPAGDFLYRFGDPARYDQGEPPRILDNWTKATSGHKQIGGAHDVQWIDAELPGEGNFLVFNNGQYLFEATPQSYIYEIDGFLDAGGRDTGNYVNPPDAGYYQQEYLPDTHKGRRQLSNQLVWIYGSLSNQGFFSHIGAGCQRLPNGNTLICSDTEGHFFEVTADGKLVWEYINPVTKEFGILKIMPDTFPMAASVFRCYRYGPDHPAFKDKDMTPKGLISEVARRSVRRSVSEDRFPQPHTGGPGQIRQEQRPERGRSPRPDDRFMRMDQNSDGQVRFEEFMAHEKQKKGGQPDKAREKRKFDEIDSNNDGIISQEEMANAPRGRKGEKR